MDSRHEPTTSAHERLRWQEDGVLLDDLVFRTVNHSRHAHADQFDLCKTRWQIDRYASFLGQSALEARNVVELGIWDGGSTALWFEMLQPQRLVAIDRDARGDSEYFTRYVSSRRIADRLRTYWKTDQGDGDRLREIVAAEFERAARPRSSTMPLISTSPQERPSKLCSRCFGPVGCTSSRTGSGNTRRASHSRTRAIHGAIVNR